MESGLVSIIMPAYNCESFIKRAIDSVKNQTYGSWKLIIVNDGSTDSTETICESYAASEPRIKYISQENSGSSAARNTGLKHVTGDFVAFLDSDDWYEPNFLEVMIGKLQSTEAEVVMCDFCIDGNSEFSYSDKLIDDKDILSEFIGGYMQPHNEQGLSSRSSFRHIFSREKKYDGGWCMDSIRP